MCTQILMATYAKSLLCEMHHAEVIRLPTAVAHVVRDRMGAPYVSTDSIARWSGVVSASQVSPIPFELVICNRGASIRCHWSHVDAVSEIVGAMVPDMILDMVPNVLRVAGVI